MRKTEDVNTNKRSKGLLNVFGADMILKTLRNEQRDMKAIVTNLNGVPFIDGHFVAFDSKETRAYIESLIEEDEDLELPDDYGYRVMDGSEIVMYKIYKR